MLCLLLGYVLLLCAFLGFFGHLANLHLLLGSLPMGGPCLQSLTSWVQTRSLLKLRRGAEPFRASKDVITTIVTDNVADVAAIVPAAAAFRYANSVAVSEATAAEFANCDRGCGCRGYRQHIESRPQDKLEAFYSRYDKVTSISSANRDPAITTLHRLTYKGAYLGIAEEILSFLLPPSQLSRLKDRSRTHAHTHTRQTAERHTRQSVDTRARTLAQGNGRA